MKLANMASCLLIGNTCKLTHFCVYTIENHYCWFKIKLLLESLLASKPNVSTSNVLGIFQVHISQEKPTISHYRQDCQFSTKSSSFLKLRENTRNPKGTLNRSTNSYSSFMDIKQIQNGYK